MLTPQQSLRETHLIGPACREWIVSQDRFPQLRSAKLAYVGYSVLRPPYRMVRMPVRDSHIVACWGGRGRALIQGREVAWGPGQVLLSPARTMHAFEIEGRGPWKIAWVFYIDAKGPPVIPGDATRLVKLDASAFINAVQALNREAAGPAEPAAIQALTTLVDIHGRRLAGAPSGDERLWRLWESVEANLNHPWTLKELAALIAVSEEHLRRLCWREHQRAPMDHVFNLRMHRAATLLRASQLKLDDLAQHVGFASVYSFSAAFKRWSGTPPSQFRERAVRA